MTGGKHMDDETITISRGGGDVGRPIPSIWMSRQLPCRIMCSIGALPPESGGILLGPIGSNAVTDFFFDGGSNCTGTTYAPDHVTLRQKMREEWMPSGVDMKGFVHSHPGGFDRLSGGDLEYIARLLAKNPDMEQFAAPIVIPEQFRLCAFVVLRERPGVQHFTRLRLF